MTQKEGLQLVWCEADRRTTWEDVVAALKACGPGAWESIPPLEDVAPVRQGFWYRTRRGAQVFFVLSKAGTWIQELAALMMEWMNEHPDVGVESVQAFVPFGGLIDPAALRKLFRFPVQVFCYRPVADQTARYVILEAVSPREGEPAQVAVQLAEGAPPAPVPAQAVPSRANRLEDVKLTSAELEAFLELDVELAQYFQSHLETGP